MCMYMHTCRGQRTTLGIFLYWFPFYSLGALSFLNLKLSFLPVWSVRELLGCSCLCSSQLEFWAQGGTPSFCVGAGDLNPGPHGCTGSAPFIGHLLRQISNVLES